jgi:uncharacterized membrane protein
MRQHISKSLLLYFALLLLAISGFFLTVIFPTPGGFYAFIIIAALGGFGVSATIWHTKKGHGQLVCPTGSNCNAVITSHYAKFFGIPLEYLGMLYFAFICIAYLVRILFPEFLADPSVVLLMLFSTGAFFFSSYLLFVQAFLLRQWCIWCVLAAMLSMTIFFISLISLGAAVEFLGNITNFLMMLKSLGFALGMGGSTAAVFSFFKCLRDLDIDSKEANILKGISELIWLGLGLTLMSQFALYTAQAEVLAQSSHFLAQIIALFGVAFSGAVLLIILAPFLAYIPFTKSDERHHHTSFTSIRRATFITGSIAISSWYFAFAINYLPEFRLLTFLIVYGVVLIAAVAVSLIWEQTLIRGKTKQA